MDRRTQCLGPRRIFGTAVEVPDLRFVQRAKHAFLVREDNDVLVLPVDHAHRPVLRRLEDAVDFQILAECESLALACAVALQPPRQRLAGHPIRLRLTGELENRGRERRLVRYKCNRAAFLLVRCPDDQRDVDNRPGLIPAAMLIDAAVESFPRDRPTQ